MKTTRHMAASAVAGAAVYNITGSGQMAASVFLGGVFLDLDHILDFFVLSNERFSFRNFFSWFNDIRWNRLYVVLHSYECYIPLLILACLLRNDVLTGLTVGIGLHLAMDQFGNTRSVNGVRLSPWFYFLSFRYTAGFDREKMRVRDP